MGPTTNHATVITLKLKDSTARTRLFLKNRSWVNQRKCRGNRLPTGVCFLLNQSYSAQALVYNLQVTRTPLTGKSDLFRGWSCIEMSSF